MGNEPSNLSTAFQMQSECSVTSDGRRQLAPAFQSLGGMGDWKAGAAGAAAVHYRSGPAAPRAAGSVDALSSDPQRSRFQTNGPTIGAAIAQ